MPMPDKKTTTTTGAMKEIGSAGASSFPRSCGIALLAAAWFCVGVSAADDLTQRIRVSPDGHFFVQSDGKPFFWQQDWGYELFKIPDRDTVDRYFKDRSGKGFNIIMAPLTGMLEDPNRYGELPFIDNDPLRPNPRYFENADWIIERAAQYGIRIALLPSWGDLVTGGFNNRAQILNVRNAEQYGYWLAARYRDKGIIWVLGGDTNPFWPKSVALDQLGQDNKSGKKTSKVIIDHRPVFDALAKGIEKASGGDALITYHPTGGHWAGTPQPRTSLYFADRPWLDLNMIQSGHHLFPKPIAEMVGMESVWNATLNYEPVSEEYNSKPARPIIDSEPLLEDEAINYDSQNGYWTAYHVRNSAYHALFAGAAGIGYFNVAAGMLHPRFDRIVLTHRHALSSAGSQQMQHAKALMLSRPYFTRVPDQSLVVGDQRRGLAHVGATRDREGSYAMVYLPHGADVTVQMSKLSGKTAVAWWFDPRTGRATQVDGEFPTSGTQTFAPPSSGADIDWILVLDDKSRGFSPPGFTSRFTTDSLGQAPLNAVTLERFVGKWLLVPRASPEKATPGAIPQAFLISKRGDALQGTFQWNGEEFRMKDFALQGNLLVLKLEAKESPSWLTKPLGMLFRLSDDGQHINAWLDWEPAGEAPFLARRVTAEELAAIVRKAPKISKWGKEPLPPLREVPANGLAHKPPMGWNSWNVFKEAIDDRTIREMADALVSSGLRDVGYVYINIDDGWQGHRDANGVLHANEKFPDMKALADYVHARGLKLGIYSSPGPVTCAGHLGSHGYEEQDAKTFAQWGVDLLKYDWCRGAERLYKTQPEMQALYQKMGEALRATGRPIVYSLCQYGMYDVGSWGRKVGGHLWRTGGDSVEGDLWKGIDHRFDRNGHPEHAGPGGWNDADMMLVGLKGLTEEEYRTHFTLWAISASPLILGNDLRTMPQAVKAILMNREVIAVNQDALGVQGRRAVKTGAIEVWTKPLSDGSIAVALFNRGEEAAQISVDWTDLNLKGVRNVRDLWRGVDLDKPAEGYRAVVPPHASVLLRVVAVQ